MSVVDSAGMYVDFEKSPTWSFNGRNHTLKLHVGLSSNYTWVLILNVFIKRLVCAGGFRERFYMELQCINPYIEAPSWGL